MPVVSVDIITDSFFSSTTLYNSLYREYDSFFRKSLGIKYGSKIIKFLNISKGEQILTSWELFKLQMVFSTEQFNLHNSKEGWDFVLHSSISF